jgi:hypothetical protein
MGSYLWVHFHPLGPTGAAKRHPASGQQQQQQQQQQHQVGNESKSRARDLNEARTWTLAQAAALAAATAAGEDPEGAGCRGAALVVDAAARMRAASRAVDDAEC